MENITEKKNKGGRPTKYKEDAVEKLDAYTKDQVEKNRLPLLEDFAYFNNVDIDTITNWGSKHPRFFGAIKRLKTAQSGMLQLGIYTNSGNVTGGIFLLKNNHGFKDRHETDVTSGGEKITGINYLPPTDANNN